MEFKPGQVLKRTVSVYGVGTCVAEISADGIVIKAKGSRVGVTAPWSLVARGCDTPAGVPSKLFGQPLELLKAEAAKVATRRAKRESHD